LPQSLEEYSDSNELAINLVNRGYYSISDEKRLELAEEYLRRKRIIFIDRDGTIHEKAAKGEYISRVEDVKLLDETVDAMKILSTYGYSFVIITNQAGIGRRILKEEDVAKVNRYIVNLLGQRDIEIEEVVVCPHHWEENCICRKPKPYMLIETARKYNLETNKTYYIGDDIRDMQAAKSAGCIGIRIYDDRITIANETGAEVKNMKQIVNIVIDSLSLTEGIIK